MPFFGDDLDDEDAPIPHIESDLFETQSDDEEPLGSGPTVPEVLLEAVESVETSIVRLDDEQEQENGAEESDEEDGDDDNEDIPTAPMEESAATPKAAPKAKRGAPAGRKRKAGAASDEPAAKRPGRGRATAAAASSAIKKGLSKRTRAPNGQAKAPPKKATAAKRGPKPKTVEPEEEFEVERIDDHKVKGKATLFFVKWKGYPDEENTWEPKSNLAHAAELLKDYEASAKEIKADPTPKKAVAPKKTAEPRKSNAQKQKPGPKSKPAAAKKTGAKPAGRGAHRSSGRSKKN